MIAGGVTERLGYFAGYIHLMEETARARDLYEEISASNLARSEDAPRAHYGTSGYDLEDMRVGPVRLLDVAPYREIFINAPFGALAFPSIPGKSYPASLPLRPPVRPESEALPDAAGNTASGRPGQPVLRVTYEEGGDDSIVQIRQFNELSDIDYILDNPDAGIPQFHTLDVTQTVSEILAETSAQVPSGLALGEWSAQAFVELVEARNVGHAGDYPEGLAPTVENGLYIDGQLQAVGTERPELPTLDPLTPAGARFGLTAETGGNNAVNAASIVDTSAFRGGLIVLGDYFETNAIIQANVLHDDDHVTWGGNRGGAGLERSSASELVTNIAEFSRQGLGFSSDGLRVGLNWNVDVVRGDLFDVNMLQQRNVLTDSDVTVQSHFTSYYELRTGDNQAINLTELFQSGTYYDLIVIGGSYREANLIFQTNVLLDDDYLWTVSAGDSGMDHDFRSGYNALRNDASISHFGQYDLRPLDGPAGSLADAIANQTLDLATMRASGVPGNGSGNFNVLYIDGDYFSLNLISQINVIADLDTAIQIIRGGADGAIGTLSTGANQLLNAASITQVGSGSSYNYLGGQHYEESVLVQTNMISDHDEVTYANVDALAPEIIAFLGDADPQAEYYQPQTQIYPESADVMGGVLT